MKAKRVWIVSELVMVVLIGCLVVNWYVKPLPDWLLECIGVLVLINLVVLVYSFVKIRK